MKPWLKLLADLALYTGKSPREVAEMTLAEAAFHVKRMRAGELRATTAV